MSIGPLFPAAALLLMACASSHDVSNPSAKKSFVVTGVMKYINIEAGCWYLESTGGDTYQPAGEDLQDLRRENLRVELLVRPMKGIYATCQIGQVVEVIAILSMGE